jgi:hypothetical protein
MTALPPSLVVFGSQLEAAIGRTRRRRRTGRRVAALTTAAAVGLVAVMVGLFGGATSASAVELAQAALTGSEGEILHVVAVTTTSGPDGVTATSQSELWQQSAAPYDEREVSVGRDGARGRELAVAQGRPQYYDPLTNTIHTTAPDVVMPKAELDDEITGRGLLERMRALVESGDAREDGHVTIDGRDAIRIVAEDFTLVVDANSHEPIEWHATLTENGRVETSTTRIETYEWLPPTEANHALVNLSAQHPTAAIVPDATVSGVDGPKGS